MNFEFKDGLIWISVDLIYEGKLVRVDNCILDTGSETTAIDIDDDMAGNAFYIRIISN